MKPDTVHPHDLRDLRARLGMTQKEAAEAIGVSRRTYIKYEGSGAPKRVKLAMERLLTPQTD